MAYTYPILLDLHDRLVVIVGGGSVALRKANGLFAAGANRIRVVAPVVKKGFPEGCECILEVYNEGHLGGASLVFAATDDPGINDAVVRDAHRLNLFVCRADSAPADFATPAMLQQGSVTLAVSTAGAPALAALLRDQLASHLDPELVKMADAMQTIRPKILACQHLPIARRQEIFRSLATSPALKTLAAGDLQTLWVWLRKQFPELPDL